MSCLLEPKVEIWFLRLAWSRNTVNVLSLPVSPRVTTYLNSLPVSEHFPVKYCGTEWSVLGTHFSQALGENVLPREHNFGQH